MSTPCGKCSACPCSKKDKRQPEQSQPQQAYTPQQQQQQQQYQQYQQQQQQPRSKSPKVECHCTSRRKQTPTEAEPQAPVADTYTCSRVRPEPVRQVPMEERCTCRIKAPPAQCECDPPAPVQPQTSYGLVEEPPTHAQISCGQSIPKRYNERPQFTVRGPGQCGHCKSQKKKKCVIQ